jgi:hypothetical protein
MNVALEPKPRQNAHTSLQKASAICHRQTEPFPHGLQDFCNKQGSLMLQTFLADSEL